MNTKRKVLAQFHLETKTYFKSHLSRSGNRRKVLAYKILFISEVGLQGLEKYGHLLQMVN